MIKRWPSASLFGVLAVCIYIMFTLISYLHYPEPYSPLTHALSQLGSPPLNPSGAIFYNLGGILLGALLIPFYLGLRSWNTGERRQRILTAGSQVVGILSSLALISSCVFPAGTHTSIHVVSAGITGVTSVFFWVFSAFAMLRNPTTVKWIPYFGYLPVIGNGITYFITKDRFLFEWVSVSLFLVYVILLAYNLKVMNVAKANHPDEPNKGLR